MPSEWGLTPRQRIEAECARRGEGAVVSGCVDLLAGRPVDDGLVLALAGPHGQLVLDGREGRHWLRVWGARGLCYAWDRSATDALIGAAADEAWRVREMAAKVVARHRVGDALDAVARLRPDPVARVRAAAERAVTRITEAGA